MTRWVVTGPTGAGKSAVTTLLAARGAVVIDGDALGHDVLRDVLVREAIAVRFGPEVVAGGSIDRARLGRTVFADPAALADLDAIMHGPLGLRMEAEFAAAELVTRERIGASLAVLEAAVYFRLPAPPRADLVVAVLAAPELRAVRLAARTGLALEATRARVLALSHLDRDWNRSDVTIRNEGSAEDLAAAVDRLWAAHAA
ncbi:MAG: dephospho-CoA kinase [bacterium]|nr:dephospho-CoA kinase [bacterium]